MINLKLLKYFIIVFLVSFSLINWNDISWIFNYEFVSATISNFFQKENYQALSNSEKENRFEYTDRKNSLEIPKIEISASLIIGKSSDEKELEKELKKGVVLFPNSALPGEKGQTIILGHSALSQWPKTSYLGVFSELNELKTGDNIFVYFNNRKYTYYVREKFYLDKGEEIPQKPLTNSENMLTLLSCWPPGRLSYRIAVQAELIE